MKYYLHYTIFSLYKFKFNYNVSMTFNYMYVITTQCILHMNFVIWTIGWTGFQNHHLKILKVIKDSCYYFCFQTTTLFSSDDEPIIRFRLINTSRFLDVVGQFEKQIALASRVMKSFHLVRGLSLDILSRL